MTTVLHLPAAQDAPIACDMTSARDTPDARLAEYHRLFEQALAGRERRDDGVVFTFRAGAGVRELVEDLARREAACCPFLDYRVEIAGDSVVWTIADSSGRADVHMVLDAFHALPEHPGCSDLEAYFGRLADCGLVVVETEDGRFEPA